MQKPKKELEKKIDAYVKGDLSENEAQKMWAELLKHPLYIDWLQTEIDLTRHHRQTTRQGNFQQYWKWAAAAAAVVLVVAGLNLLSSETLNDYTVERILLRENLATAGVMRSDEPNSEIVDSLLNIGFESAVSGNINKAVSIYEEVIEKYPNTPYAAKAHLNTGIITYNRGKYTSAISSFEKVVSVVDQNNFIIEQAYWYMGNALINIEKYRRAHEALKKAYQLNGIHKEDAQRLLEKLKQELS